MADGQEQLNQIDQQILALVLRRIEFLRTCPTLNQAIDPVSRLDGIVQSVASESNIDPQRCRSLLRHVSSLCDAELATRCIAFLGPTHSYSHLAAIKYFGDAAPLMPEGTIAAVFDAVVRGQASMGIVPVENSTDGRVVDTLGMFVHNPVNICGEVLLPIHHFLLSNSPRESITEIHSKPQALSQCRTWLAQHLPHAQLKEISSTAAAASLASQREGVAAIASEAAGREYGLKVLAANIEDNPNNITRFAVLGEQESESTGDDKTALMLQIVHRPGALADVMNVFKTCSLNLTFIESFPLPSAPNEYLFFVELEGHKYDQAVTDAIDRLRGLTIRREILGSFPKDRSYSH